MPRKPVTPPVQNPDDVLIQEGSVQFRLKRMGSSVGLHRTDDSKKTPPTAFAGVFTSLGKLTAYLVSDQVDLDAPLLFQRVIAAATEMFSKMG